MVFRKKAKTTQVNFLLKPKKKKKSHKNYVNVFTWEPVTPRFRSLSPHFKKKFK